MIISGDFYLNGPVWEKLRENLINKHKFFDRIVDIFIIACSIGIAGDNQKSFEGEIITIARDTYQTNNDISDAFDFMMKNAILTSNHINFDIETRMKMAFDSEFKISNFSPVSFLIKFANHGAEKIEEIISEHDIDTADHLIDLINNYVKDNFKDNIKEIELM
jgi:hypothetical protein